MAAPASAAPAQAPSGPVPATASGCNGYVCITIDGSGTTVNEIQAQVQNPYSYAYNTTGSIYDNGSVIYTFSPVDLSPYPNKDLQTWPNPAHTFAAGDKVCAAYSGISGEPCETIG
jgi:hypothetical protein